MKNFSLAASVGAVLLTAVSSPRREVNVTPNTSANIATVRGLNEEWRILFTDSCSAGRGAERYVRQVSILLLDVVISSIVRSMRLPPVAKLAGSFDALPHMSR